MSVSHALKDMVMYNRQQQSQTLVVIGRLTFTIYLHYFMLMCFEFITDEIINLSPLHL